MNKYTTARLVFTLLVLSVVAWGVHQRVASAKTEDARPMRLQTTPRPTLAQTETPTPMPTVTPIPTVPPTAPPAPPAAQPAMPTAPLPVVLPVAGGGPSFPPHGGD